MRARPRLDLILSVLRKYQCLIADETVNFEIDEDADTPHINGRLGFLHGPVSMLTEVVLPSGVRCGYNYGDVDAELIFRYDNASHHPEVKTFTHHKHVPSGILDSSEKLLSQLMEEVIDQFVAGE